MLLKEMNFGLIIPRAARNLDLSASIANLFKVKYKFSSKILKKYVIFIYGDKFTICNLINFYFKPGS